MAQWYQNGLKGSLVLTPTAKEWAEHVYHLYVIQTEKRDHLVSHLKEKGVQTGIHYPIPNHQQPAVRNTLGFQPKLERTEAATQGILSLPMFPELQRNQVDFVCQAVREFFGRNG